MIMLISTAKPIRNKCCTHFFLSHCSIGLPARNVKSIANTGTRLMKIAERLGPILAMPSYHQMLVIAVISVLDWFRGPDRRTHLGNFVQRILDGDALDVISRKAVASADTIVSVVGIGSLLIGVVLWIVIFTYVVPRVSPEFSTVRSTLIAALIVAIVGTLLNDGGIFVWLTVTAQVTTVAGWFFLDWAERNDWTVSPVRVERR